MVGVYAALVDATVAVGFATVGVAIASYAGTAATACPASFYDGFTDPARPSDALAYLVAAASVDVARSTGATFCGFKAPVVDVGACPTTFSPVIAGLAIAVALLACTSPCATFDVVVASNEGFFATAQTEEAVVGPFTKRSCFSSGIADCTICINVMRRVSKN